MSKAIKFKNNMYLDTRGAVHNGTILKTYLDNLNTNIVNTINKLNRIYNQEFLIGTYPIITAPRNGSSGNGIHLETRYNFKEGLLNQFPLKDGFTRKYIAQSTINTGSGTFSMYIGGYFLLDEGVWGANNNSSMRTKAVDVTNVINSLGNGHTNVTVNANVWWWINICTLLVYDIPN